MSWLWWILGAVIIFFGICYWIGSKDLADKKYTEHKPTEEYIRIYNQIDTMSLSELKKLKSQLADYGVYAGPLWAFREPEWELEDYKRARNKIIENGPVCGCVTYGEAADMYDKVFKTQLHKER